MKRTQVIRDGAKNISLSPPRCTAGTKECEDHEVRSDPICVMSFFGSALAFGSTVLSFEYISHRHAGKICLFRSYHLRSTILPAWLSSFSILTSLDMRMSSCTSKLKSGPDFPRA